MAPSFSRRLKLVFSHMNLGHSSGRCRVQNQRTSKNVAGLTALASKVTETSGVRWPKDRSIRKRECVRDEHPDVQRREVVCGEPRQNASSQTGRSTALVP